MTTIESTNKKIMDKFSIIKLIFEQIHHIVGMLDTLSIEYKTALKSSSVQYINLYASDFDELENQYVLSVINTLTSYYSNKGKHNEEICMAEFHKIIGSENFLPRIDEYLTKIKMIMAMLIVSINKKQINDMPKKVTRRSVSVGSQSAVALVAVSSERVLDDSSPLYAVVEKIKKNIDHAMSINVNMEIRRINYQTCSCGYNMIINPVLSEMVCENKECSIIRKLEGTAAEDMEPFNEFGNKAKHDNYNPNRHFKFWMERIQAKECKTFSEQEIEALEKIIKRDQLDVVSIYDMRGMLKETKMTCYNDHAALLMKLTTSKAPPTLSFTMLRKFAIKFNKIIDILETLKNPDGNRPYYPYFIYKIAEDEAILAAENNDHNECRDIRRLMQYIHLQSTDTIRKNDMLYKTICEISNAKDDANGNTEDRLTFRTTENVRM